MHDGRLALALAREWTTSGIATCLVHAQTVATAVEFTVYAVAGATRERPQRKTRWRRRPSPTHSVQESEPTRSARRREELGKPSVYHAQHVGQRVDEEDTWDSTWASEQLDKATKSFEGTRPHNTRGEVSGDRGKATLESGTYLEETRQDLQRKWRRVEEPTQLQGVKNIPNCRE